jgi:hypothetical protein
MTVSKIKKNPAKSKRDKSKETVTVSGLSLWRVLNNQPQYQRSRLADR